LVFDTLDLNKDIQHVGQVGPSLVVKNRHA